MRGIFYIIIFLFVSGCSYCNQQPRILDEAESMMDSDPSAALTSLNSLDISELEDSATLARWALLYSEALVANNLSAPTDTIVCIAINYYKRHNLDNQYLKATRLKEILKSTDSGNTLATALYLQKEKEFFLYKERAERKQITYVSLLILLIAAGIIVWMRQRMKLQSALNDALIAEAADLKDKLDSGQGKVGILETKLRQSLETRFSFIDSLCQTYYESQGTKTERNAIVNKVKHEIDAIRSDSLPEIEKAVNDCFDNLLVQVTEIIPNLKTDDYRLLVYIASGLSTRTISLLLDESVEVVYKRKSRLKSRLKESLGADNRLIARIF